MKQQIEKHFEKDKLKEQNEHEEKMNNSTQKHEESMKKEDNNYQKEMKKKYIKQKIPDNQSPGRKK